MGPVRPYLQKGGDRAPLVHPGAMGLVMKLLVQLLLPGGGHVHGSLGPMRPLRPAL